MYSRRRKGGPNLLESRRPGGRRVSGAVGSRNSDGFITITIIILMILTIIITITIIIIIIMISSPEGRIPHALIWGIY